jgi:hypothetical protein
MIDAQSDAPTASQGLLLTTSTQQQQQPLDAQHTAVLHLDAQHTYYRYMYGTTVVALAIDRTAVHDCTQPRTGTSTNYEYEYLVRYVPTVVRTAVLEATVATTTS